MKDKLIINNNSSSTIRFFDHRFFNFVIQGIISCVAIDVSIIGLPKTQKNFRVIRSPHVNKKSMEHFKITWSKYLLNFANFKFFNALRVVLDYSFYTFKYYSKKDMKNSKNIIKVWFIRDTIISRIVQNKENIQGWLGFFIITPTLDSVFLICAFTCIIIFIGYLRSVKTPKINIKPIAFFSFWDIFLAPDYIYKKWKIYRAKRLIRKAAEAEAEAKRKAYEPKRRELEDYLLRGIGDEDPRNKWDREILDPLAVDGELQEIYAIEQEVDKLLTLLSEDEKKEFYEYLGKEHYSVEFPNFAWTNYYNEETGRLLDSLHRKDIAWRCMNKVITWKLNTLKFYEENGEFPWVADELAYQNALEDARSHFPEREWFNEFFWYLVSGRVKFSLKEYYEARSIQKYAEFVDWGSVTWKGLLDNYHLAVDKLVYNYYLKPKPIKQLKLHMEDIYNWVSFYQRTSGTYMPEDKGVDKDTAWDWNAVQDGGIFTKHLHDLYHFDKYWYNSYNPTKNHPYNVRVLGDKQLWYIQAVDHWNNDEPVMLAFKGSKWVEVISLPEYVSRVRSENDMVHEREALLEEVSRFYDQYTFREYFQRQVQWLEEYSAILHTFGLEKRLRWGDLYYRYYVSNSRARTTWANGDLMWDPYCDGGQLASYYFTKLDTLRDIYQGYMWWPIIKIGTYFLLVFFFDFLLRFESLKLIPGIQKYRIWRTKAKEYVYEKTSEGLIYSHDLTIFVSFVAYFIFTEGVPRVYETRKHFFRTFDWHLSLKDRYKNNRTTAIYDKETDTLKCVTIREPKVEPSFGLLTDFQFKVQNNLMKLSLRFRYIGELLDEVSNRFFSLAKSGFFSKYLSSVLITEHGYLKVIVTDIIMFPQNFWKFSVLAVEYICNFILTLPVFLMKTVPEFLVLVYLTALNMLEGVLNICKWFIELIISEFLCFWLFIARTISNWFTLMFVNPYNFIVDTFIAPVKTFFRMLGWTRREDWHHVWHNYNRHIIAIKWLRHKDRYRPEEHFSYNDTTDIISWTMHKLRYLEVDLGKEYFEFVIEKFIWGLRAKFDHYREFILSNPLKQFHVNDYKSFRICFLHHWHFYVDNVLAYQIDAWRNKWREEILQSYHFKASWLSYWDFWLYNSVASVLLYPMVFIWQKVVIQPYVSLRYLFELWWENIYTHYLGRRTHRKSDVFKYLIDKRFDYAKEFWFDNIKGIFISFYDFILLSLKVIIYPFSAIKWYLNGRYNELSEYISSTYTRLVMYFKIFKKTLWEMITDPIVHHFTHVPMEKVKKDPIVKRWKLLDCNLAEDKYPLTAHQKLLDNVGLFNKLERNLIILEHSGYTEDVKNIRNVVKQQMDLTKELKPERESISYFILKDFYVTVPTFDFQLFITIKDFIGYYATKYFYPVWDFIINVDIVEKGLPFILNLPRLIPLWLMNIKLFFVRLVNYILKLSLEVYDNVVFLFMFTKTFKRYMEHWYFITWENLDLRLFVDLFYYWLYDVPEDYFCERYTKTWHKESWFAAERYQLLRRIHQTGNGKLHSDTRIWGYYHQNYWENRSYFKGTKLEFLYTLLKSIFDDINTWRKEYIEQKFFFNYPKFHNKFGNRKYVATWTHKYDQDYVDPIRFKGDELIEYYLLRSKYSILFFIKSFFQYIDYYVSIISTELWVVLRGLVSTPVKLFHLLGIIRSSNISFKQGCRNILNNFHIAFTNRHITPVIDGIISYYNYFESQLIYVLKVIVLWYITPIEEKYSMKFEGFTSFNEFYSYVKFKITTKQLYIDIFYQLKDNSSEVYDVFVFAISRTKEGIIVCYNYIMLHTERGILLLKEKIIPYCEPYLQEFHSRVEYIGGLYSGLEDRYSLLNKALNNFTKESSIENMFHIFDAVIILVYDSLDSVFEMFLTFYIWTISDVWSLIWGFIKNIPNMIYGIFELFIFGKYNYYRIMELVIFIITKFFKMLYDLYIALYYAVFELTAELINYFATSIAWVLQEIFVIESYAYLISYFVYGPCLTISYYYNIIVYIIDCILNFNIQHFFIRVNMLFTDFWQYMSLGEYWWDNVVLIKLYSMCMPLVDWLSFNLSTRTKPGKAVIRGDYNRRLPFLVGDNYGKLSKTEKAHLAKSFNDNVVGKEDLSHPSQAWDLWSTHHYVSKYITMLDGLNLPYFVKKSMFLHYLTRMHWHALVICGPGKKYGYRRGLITRYFKYIIDQNHFGARWVDFSTMDKITKYSKVLEVKDEVIRRWWVADSFFVEWYRNDVENVWSKPTLLNHLSKADQYWIREKIEDNVDHFIEEDVWQEADLMYSDGLETILEYQLHLQNADEIYEFMSFNQKIYNFYLDMFGPEFAYIYYHFPGTSLQLNDERLSYNARVEWLSDFIYSTKSRVLSNLSMVNRLNDLDFKKYMAAVDTWARLNLYIKNHFVTPNTMWFNRTRFLGDRDYYDGGKPGYKIHNLQAFVSHYMDVVYEDDDELDSEYIGPLYGLIDEDVVGPGDDYLPWWDDVDKQFGWKFGYKVPFEWFYKIPYFEFPKWPFFEKSVYWLRYFPKELLPVQRFRYHRNYFGYGEDWEIGGLSIRDRLVALELQNSIVARTWTECFNDTLLVTKDVYYTYSFFAHEKYNLRSPTEVIIGPPNIDIRDYNRVITEKMHNKPSCYDYWVFYEKKDNVASSLNNFENLNVLNNNVFYDAPSEWQYGFQDPASPIMEGIIDLHHDLCFFLILVSVFVSWILFNIVYYFNTTNYNFKVSVKNWFQEEVRETLIDLVYVWYKLTTRIVQYANNNKENEVVNTIAKGVYSITMWFIYWENVYFNKWVKEKEIENLIVNSTISNESILPQNFVDILKYINTNGYSNVEYFYDEVECKGYFISKDNEKLYNEFKNNPSVTSHTVKLNTILNNLVAVRGLQLELSSKYFGDVDKGKKYLNEVLEGKDEYFDSFEEKVEEAELKEEFVWFPQLFTHNTTIEVVWTIIPAIILVCIAIPSFSLLYAMDQIWQPLFTIKVLGNQWYWSYEYC